MFFIEIAKPNWFERLLIVIAQFVFLSFYTILYLISSSTAHKMVAYFEEEAVKSYTDYLELIKSGEIEDVPAPQLAIEYYGLKRTATLSTMVMSVRDDERKHSKVNHRMAGF